MTDPSDITASTMSSTTVTATLASREISFAVCDAAPVDAPARGSVPATPAVCVECTEAALMSAVPAVTVLFFPIPAVTLRSV